LSPKKEAAGYVYLALAHTCAGDGAGAVRAADDGLAVEPANANLRWARARGLIQRKLYTEALADINRSLEQDPNAPGYWTTRAVALASLGRRAEAIVDLERALQLSPSDPDALRTLDELRRMP
jgi:Flp pilus assembly protein TadD